MVVVAAGPSIVALDRLTGTERWRTRVRAEGTVAARAIAVGAGIAIVPDVAAVVALDLGTGVVRWRFRPDDQADRADPVVVGDAALVGTWAGTVYALDATTGRVRWAWRASAGTRTGIVEGIAAAGDTVYAALAAADGRALDRRHAIVVALRLADGRELWRYESAGDAHDVRAAPAVAGPLLLGGDEWGATVFALDRGTGGERWRTPTGASPGPAGGVAVRGDTAFVGARDGSVVALDVLTGRVRWRARHRYTVRGAVACGARVWVTDQGITAFDVATGRWRSTTPTGDGADFPTSRPATDGEAVYVAGAVSAWRVPCPGS